MKITVVCAAGKQGLLLVKEAIVRGHEVTAIVRNEADRGKVDAKAKVVVKDLFDLTYKDIEDADAVIDAFGAWTPETLPLHRTSLKHLADLLSGKPNRLLVVGGAGGLYVDPERKTRLLDTPEFPEIFKPLASVQSEALYDIRKRTDVKWTFVSPSANFDAAGKRTGTYQLGTELLLVNAAGNSEISYADYAIALIDEVESAKHIQQRITVCSR